MSILLGRFMKSEKHPLSHPRRWKYLSIYVATAAFTSTSAHLSDSSATARVLRLLVRSCSTDFVMTMGSKEETPPLFAPYAACTRISGMC